MENNINWVLVSCISSALNGFQESYHWDLSVGENSCLFEVFYEELQKGIPRSKKKVKEIFYKAYEKTWGFDHECHEPSNDEMKFLLCCCMDYFREDNQGDSRIVFRKIDSLF